MDIEETEMIEIRVVDNGLMCRPDIQYRCLFLVADDYNGGAVYKKGEIWSEWKTAPYISLMETEND